MARTSRNFGISRTARRRTLTCGCSTAIRRRSSPTQRLIEENRRRGKSDPEFEIQDTGVFDDGRYFDVTVEYAKATPEDTLMRVSVTNRGPGRRGAAPAAAVLGAQHVELVGRVRPRPHSRSCRRRAGGHAPAARAAATVRARHAGAAVLRERDQRAAPLRHRCRRLLQGRRSTTFLFAATWTRSTRRARAASVGCSIG